MNQEQFKGYWNVLKGQIKERWGKLTDDDITRIEGKRDQFLGSLQKKYGYTKEVAEREAAKWEEEFEKSDEAIKRAETAAEIKTTSRPKRTSKNSDTMRQGFGDTPDENTPTLGQGLADEDATDDEDEDENQRYRRVS